MEGTLPRWLVVRCTPCSRCRYCWPSGCTFVASKSSQKACVATISLSTPENLSTSPTRWHMDFLSVPSPCPLARGSLSDCVCSGDRQLHDPPPLPVPHQCQDELCLARYSHPNPLVITMDPAMHPDLTIHPDPTSLSRSFRG